ncbi:hypothetical protein PVAG01_10651 [Phlyctema vagabunda]|uniref:Yeast cell wall synthesis Kre9/Knh1-like N-terminal domain-containing protein n=1 Tax=Phlyctema vagabunda TaxID=108571 RepID=A0ABR4P2Y6_9HELO
MRFSTSFVLAALASLVAAQNPFTFTTLSSITAGQPFDITWAPSTGDVQTVTLILRQGDPNNLNTVTTIAAGIENTGSFSWTPPTTLVNGDGYAFEIQNDLNPAINNYSNQFSISSPNTVTPSSTAAASTSSSAVTSTSVSASTTTGSTTGTSTVSNDSTTSTGTSTGATTGTSSSTTVRTTTTRSSSSGTSSASSAPTVSSINAAGSLKVGTGMLAVVGAVMVAL